MHTREDILHNKIGSRRLVGKTKRRWTGAAEEIPKRYAV
jgi:hypothetical protein